MKRIAIVLLLMSLITFTLCAQNAHPFTLAQLDQINKLKAKVEVNPASLEAHHAYIDAFYKSSSTINNPIFEVQYKTWMKQFPQNYVVPFAAGEAYIRGKNPKAASFLLQASILKPGKAETWYMLSQYARYTNNIIAEQEYLKKSPPF